MKDIYFFTFDCGDASFLQKRLVFEITYVVQGILLSSSLSFVILNVSYKMKTDTHKHINSLNGVPSHCASFFLLNDNAKHFQSFEK